jgi:hypothetical protein
MMPKFMHLSLVAALSILSIGQASAMSLREEFKISREGDELLSPKSTLQQEFREIQKLVAELIDFRIKAFKEYERLHAKTEKKLNLTGEDLNLIHSTVIEREVISERALQFVDRYSFLMDRFYDYEKYDFLNADKELLQFFLRSLGLGLTLSDNYLQMIMFYQQDKTLRRVINEGNSIPGKDKNQLRAGVKEFYRLENIRNKRKGILAFLKYQDQIEQLANTDKEVKFWNELIKASFSFEEVKDSSKFERMMSDLGGFFGKMFKHKKLGKDFTYKCWDLFVEKVSKAFGNTAGRFQSRNGYLLGREDVLTNLKTTLKPLDILLEKTPFRLTDRFIPGYWGHNAIWLGTEKELKALDLWDHPVFKKIQDKIKEGHAIVEALRPGVQVNSIEHFLDIDDMAVMRPKKLTREELKKSLIIAASQYGKKYDFSFNVETQDVLVCSELIFMAYVDIPWRTERVVGRWTINPDAVAERGTPNNEFDLVHLYVGGKQLSGDLNSKMDYVLKNAHKTDEEILEEIGK